MYLIWARESDRTETSVLELGEDSIRIGRGTNCDIRISDSAKGVSRVHCVIQKEGQNWRLLDYSTNGTFVNGQPVQERLLKERDTIVVGPVNFILAKERPPSDKRSARGTASGLGADSQPYTAILRDAPDIRNPYRSGTRETKA